jgi:chromate transport protein ChrA
MYGLSLGVARIGEVLPGSVYALITGINAATVGIIVLAAVQLSQKVITDPFTRAIVFLGASAGMLYNALWYFPLLLILAGIATLTWDRNIIQRTARWIMASLRPQSSLTDESRHAARTEEVSLDSRLEDATRTMPSERRTAAVSLKQGCIVIAIFFTSFIIVMALRGALKERPFLFSLFSNLYLAGTIIFGGGPVVIPLLRE